MMPPKEKKIWFPAKRYGWGWVVLGQRLACQQAGDEF